MNVEATGTEQAVVPNVGVAGGAMGKEQFMQLLVAQMKNQDPTEPMDNSQMTAQLAQFSALEQMENLNNKFEGFNTQFNGFQQNSISAMSLMNSGKPVTVEFFDGSDPVTGTLEKVMWNDGETQFVVDGVEYSSGNVKSLAAAGTDAPAGEQTGAGTGA